MNAEGLLASARADSEPPPGLPAAVEALWWAAHGEWDRAHERCQEGEPRAGAWVHAHLHREEGDLGNAAYWYSRAGRPVETGALEAEWRAISEALLAARP